MTRSGRDELGKYTINWYSGEFGEAGVAQSPAGHYAVVSYHNGQFTAPVFGARPGGAHTWFANGWSERALEYVASWVSESTARRRLRQMLEG